MQSDLHYEIGAMPHFPLPRESSVGDFVRLNPEESRHIAKILRLSEGETLFLTDGAGNRYRATIQKASRRGVEVQITEKSASQKGRGSVFLALALLKKEKMDWAVQKAVELGAREIIPFVSRHTVVRGGGQKKGRWEKIAAQAVKQSGRSREFRIHEPLDWSEMLARDWKVEDKVLFWEESTDPFRLRSDSTLIVVGPEGGFADDEVAEARLRGFQVAGLGANILRAETAALAALALAQHELGNL